MSYDLTGCHFSAVGPKWNDRTNRHALSVNGKFSGTSDKDFLAVGERYGLGTTPRTLAEIKAAVDAH